MKKSVLFFLLAASFASVLAQDDKEPFMTKSFANKSINFAEVRTSGGSIHVSGVPASEARVEVYVRANNGNNNYSKEEIRRKLEEDYDLNVTLQDNKLVATAKSKSKIWDWKRSLSISFKVYVPEKVSTDLSTSGGSISLSHLSGKQEFTTSGGSLNLDYVKGHIDGKTSGGSIKVENSSDDIELTTSGGSIKAANCKGTLRLVTSGGSLDLRDLSGTISASTSGGSVRGGNIQGELNTHTSGGSILLDDIACSLDASTSGGSMRISVKELGKYIKLSNSGGNIDLALPKGKEFDLNLTAHKIKTSHMDNFSGKIEDDEIVGKLNDGGIPVEVRCGGTLDVVLR